MTETKTIVAKELAEWFRESSGRDDFYLGIGKNGQAFIKIEGIEITYKSAIKFIKEKQRKLNLRFRQKKGNEYGR